MSEEEKELIEGLHRRIQYQMNHTWLNIVDSTRKDEFLNNFSEEEKIAGLVLLDMMLLHNNAQERQLMRTLMRKLQSRIYKAINPSQDQSSDEILEIIKAEMKQAAFIPVIDKNPADSSNAWSAILREITGTSDCFFSIDALPLLFATHKKYIIFYDDMLGTGNQFDTYLRRGRFSPNDKEHVSIKQLMDNYAQGSYYYLCLAGHEDGINYLKGQHPEINVITSERFDTEDDILSIDNEYWAYYEETERNHIIEILRRILAERKIEEPFSKNLPVIFERNRPSNTSFPLYWTNESDWYPLVPREES